MSEIMQRIEAGNGWLVTFVGITGVFAALLMIYLFITWLRRLMKKYDDVRRKRLPEEALRPPQPAAAGEKPEKGGGGEKGTEELAAVAAAAWLVLRSRTGSASRNTGRSPSGWRTAGRLDLMKWPERRASRGR